MRIRPRPGLLLVFPAWLTHSIEPWRGEGERISIAINLSAQARTRSTLVDTARLPG